MVNYADGKIYKITCDEHDGVYVGSTTKKYLSCRMASHRCHHNRFMSGKTHRISSSDLVQYESATIELLELCPCETRDQLHRQERYWIEKLRKEGIKVVNILIPTQTMKEYRVARKQRHMCECGVSYSLEHKSNHIKSRLHLEFEGKEPLMIQCECGCEISKKNFKRHEMSKKHQAFLASISTDPSDTPKD